MPETIGVLVRRHSAPFLLGIAGHSCFGGRNIADATYRGYGQGDQVAGRRFRRVGSWDESQPVPVLQTSPEVIRLGVMMYVRFPPSLRNAEDLPHERGIGISHQTIRAWWNRFELSFAADIEPGREKAMRAHTQWRWHADEM
jgi:hypothetical protein